MKKILKVIVPSVVCLFAVIFGALCLGFSSCEKSKPLSDYVSELRSDLFEGNSEKYALKAAYGFKENPSLNDGKIGEKIYSLSFILLNAPADDVSRSVVFSFNDKDYRATFKYNPASDAVTASFETENFNLKSFDVKIVCGADAETVTLNSVMPENTLSWNAALDLLCLNQSELIGTYKNENNDFTGEIVQRIIVKNGKPYWYVGLMNGNGGVKALLIDGEKGEILAVREIF